MPITDQNKQVLKHSEFFIFVNFDLKGNVTDCARTCLVRVFV